jgi:hypothetical protein
MGRRRCGGHASQPCALARPWAQRQSPLSWYAAHRNGCTRYGVSLGFREPRPDQVDLRGLQRLVTAPARLEVGIEALHQQRGRDIRHRPQRGQHRSRPRVVERACQPHQALASQFLGRRTSCRPSPRRRSSPRRRPRPPVRGSQEPRRRSGQQRRARGGGKNTLPARSNPFGRAPASRSPFTRPDCCGFRCHGAFVDVSVTPTFVAARSSARATPCVVSGTRPIRLTVRG